MMLRDSNRHLEEKIAALKEENARLRAELYGKKSERTVASDLDITIEEVAAKEEPTAAAETTEQVAKIFSALEDRLKNTQNPPINALRRAIDYAIERREMLESWLYDPNIPIDNNTAERAVRPVTIGRKNCLFIGAPEAGQRSAILYTMMEGCKRCKVDSLAWLTWVLDRLPNYRGDYRDLYPSAMPKPQEQVKERTI